MTSRRSRPTSPSATPTPCRPAYVAPPTRTWSAVSGARTGPCGDPRARRRSRNRLGWLDIAERSKEQLAGVRGPQRRAPQRGLHRRHRARHGWIEPCARGVPAAPSGRPTRPDAARAGLDAPRRGRRSTSTQLDLSKTVAIVVRASRAGRSSRCRCTRPSSAPASTARTSSRSPTRHEPARSSRASRASGARLLRRPGHRRPLQRAQRRSASSRPRWRGSTSPPCSDGAIGAAGGVPAASRATPACGSAARSASWPRPAATSSRSSPTTPLSSYGIWAEQLVAESTGKHGRGILPIADEPLLDPDAYGDDRVFLHVALDDGRNARRARARSRTPATRSSRSARSARPTSAGSST